MSKRIVRALTNFWRRTRPSAPIWGLAARLRILSSPADQICLLFRVMANASGDMHTYTPMISICCEFSWGGTDLQKLGGADSSKAIARNFANHCIPLEVPAFGYVSLIGVIVLWD